MRRGAGLVLVAVLAVGLGVLGPAAPAAACSCGAPEPVTPATLDEYDVAFTGEVTRNEEIDPSRRELDVVVAEVWKGEVGATTLLVTPSQDESCGTDPPVGTEALFLTTRGPQLSIDDFATDDELTVMACGGRKDAAEAVALGKGRPPEGDDDDGVPGWVASGLIGLGGVALAVVVGRRARRRDAA
jgi:hypothetical protein